MLDKIIKKLLKWFSLLVIFLTILPFIAMGVLRIPSVQDSAVSKVLERLGSELGTEIRYSKVQIPSLNKIRFTDFYIADNHADTLVYAEKASITIPVFFSMVLKSGTKKETLRKLEFERAVLNFVIDSNRVLNFRYIVDYIQSNQKEGKEKNGFSIKKIIIKDSQYNMLNYASQFDTIGIDFRNLRTTNFQLKVHNLNVLNDTLNMDIEPMSFIDHSGFILNEMNAKLSLSKNGYLQLSETDFKTNKSDIDAPLIRFDFKDFVKFKPATLFTEVKTHFIFSDSRVNFSDIGFFTPVFANYDQEVNIAGKFRGELANFKGKELNIKWGNQSELEGNFSISGLPNADETFLVFSLSNLKTNSYDLNGFNLPKKKELKLPELFRNIETMEYKGNFTGFLNDFVAHGKLSTNLGNVVTDIMISPDSTNRARLSGNVSTANFNIGDFTGNKLFNSITLDMGVEATITKGQPISADITGYIHKIDFSDYGYQHININGQLSDKLFNGQLSVDDENLILDFDGLIDMASEVRKYDFNLNVIDANLYALKLSDADQDYHASFLLQAKAEGKSMDELNGEFFLLNSLFAKTSKQIQIYDLNLKVQNSEEKNALQLRSDLFDVNMEGHYRLSAIKPVFVSYLKSFLSKALPDSAQTIQQPEDTHFSFDVNLKYTQSFFEFFFPEYYLAEQSEISGTFSPDENEKLQLTFIAPYIKYRNNEWDWLVLNLFSADSIMQTSLGCQRFNFNQQFDFDNFTLEATAGNNNIGFKTRWSNWDSVLNKGALTGQVHFDRFADKPAVTLSVEPAKLIVSDSLWNVNKFIIGFDTAGVNVNGLKFWKSDQYVVVDGKVNDMPGDTLHFSFENFDIGNFNILTSEKDFEFGGTLNGSGNLTGRKSPLFFSALSISDLFINNEPFGNCNINSLWDNKKQSLNISATAKRGKLTMLKFEGDYYPAADGKMNFDISLNKLKTNIFNPFVDGAFSQMQGYASGDLQLTGYKGKPNLEGELFLQKNAFTVDYLKTRYNFTSRIEIANNNFIFNNLELFDKDGNSGIMNGMIRTNYLRDISLSLGLAIDNMLCMETRRIDNEYFFGTAYVSGDIKIKGRPSTLTFDIDATTNENTRIFIPLAENTEVSEYSFVHFIRNDTTDSDDKGPEAIQKVNLEGIQMDFNLNVTPEAEVQIIFDPTMGDIIKARGNGEMNLSINTLGSFDMVGEYLIERGDYLFTVQNIINKKFKIKEGSTLRWTGDPLNADIDITTVYRTKATLPFQSDAVTAESVNTETDLDPESGGGSKQSRATVDCRLFLTGKLLSPNIRYDIHLPLAEEETRDRLKSLIQTEEDMTNQFLFLMAMNQFYRVEGNSGLGGNLVGSNASELLSNQFSNWLSQISNDFDLGFTYRRGKEEYLTADEVELALSTQLLNDRLSIDGSVDMKSEAAAQNVSKFAGDFDVDYKLNEKGKIRLRAFNRSNDDIGAYAPNTQGFGIFFKEDFDTLGELANRYWAILTGKRKRLKGAEANAKTN